MAIHYGLLWWTAACILTCAANYNDEPLVTKLLKEGKIPASYLTSDQSRIYSDIYKRLEFQSGNLSKLLNYRWNLKSQMSLRKLPIRLGYLALHQTGTRKLHLQTLGVQKLTVDENYLTQIRGDASLLRHMKLTAPALEMIHMSRLKIDVLSPGFAEKHPVLMYIWLVKFRGHLPLGFLRGAKRLLSFTATQSNLTTVPHDLFAHSPNLELINFSGNRIEYLPSGLFSGLHKLRILLLQNNQLQKDTVYVIEHLTGLRHLALSSNPLGNLCTIDDNDYCPTNILQHLYCTGGVSNFRRLKHLRKLFLEDIGASHLCQDWVNDLQWLVKLDYRNNLMWRLDCADLRVSRHERVEDPVIHLTGNPITQAVCTKKQYNEVVYYGEVPIKELKMIVSSRIKCGCGWSHMHRVLPLLHVSLQLPEGHEICSPSKLEALSKADACP